jgi:DNA-binding NtrC family response regulator
MGRIRQKLEIAAGSKIAVLLRGHSGIGKEVLANLLHSLSPWRNGAFVKIS